MTAMHPVDLETVASRHADLLAQSSARHYKPILLGAGMVLYLVYCWWFFAIGAVLQNANWAIAGTYLADWVSYEVRPEIKVATDGAMSVDYGKFSPLGQHPNPDWVKLQRKTVVRTQAIDAEPVLAAPDGANSLFMAPSTDDSAKPAVQEAEPGVTSPIPEDIVVEADVAIGSVASVHVQDKRARVTYDNQVLTVRLDGADQALVEGSLPVWAKQKTEGGKITLAFGMNGWAEIQGDEVSVRNRFFGWANFLFDTSSPFFGKSYGEVASLILSGERLDPSRSNLALAWNNILYNAEWQHLDVWTKLFQTIVMAFIGTLFASILAFPLCFLAARNITHSLVVNQLTKRLFDFLRSVDMLIWALFFTRAFGPGPIAGMSAIFFTDTGTFGKLYSEALENIDEKPREGVKSVGAPPLAVQRFGVLPQVLPVFASQSLYFWESNTRSATIIGAVGAGGIGLKLWEAIRTNSDWENVAYMVVLILLVVFIFDSISSALRSRLMGSK